MPTINIATNIFVIRKGRLSMKLYIKRDFSACNCVFVIYDELGKEKYTVVAEKVNLFYLKTSDNICVAKIKRISISNLLAYNINVGNKKIRLLVTVSKGELSGVCYGNNWKICGSAAAKTFAITDVDNSIVARQSKVYLKHDAYELEIFRESKELLSLSAAVCINMLNSVDNPIAQTV